MMNCKEVVDLLSDYLEDELPEEHFAEIRAHLKRCSNCAAFLDSLKTTIRLTHSSQAEDIPSEVLAGLQTFLRSKIRSTIRQ